MKVKAVITARMASTRLERKMVRDLHGIPLVSHVAGRSLLFPEISSPDDIVLAIPESAENDVLLDLGKEIGVKVFRGSEEDVLSRIIGAAESVDADVIYRVTGDNPLIDPGVVSKTFDGFISGEWDYTVMEDTPLGTTSEIVSVNALKKAREIALHSDGTKYFEHPTLAIYENSDKFKMNLIGCPEKWNRPDWRFTIDTEDDFKLVEAIMGELGIDATLDTIVPWLEKNMQILGINAGVSQQGWENLKERKESIRGV